MIYSANNTINKGLSTTKKDKFKAIHFGIDYIRLIYPKYFKIADFENFFTGLSANSPYKEIDWFGFHFVLDYGFNASNRTIKVSYDGFPIFRICLYDNQNAVVNILLVYKKATLPLKRKKEEAYLSIHARKKSKRNISPAE